MEDWFYHVIHHSLEEYEQGLTVVIGASGYVFLPLYEEEIMRFPTGRWDHEQVVYEVIAFPFGYDRSRL